MTDTGGANVSDGAIDVLDDPNFGKAFHLRGGMFSPADALALGSRLLALACAVPGACGDVERARPRSREIAGGVGVALLGDVGPEIVLGRESATAFAQDLAATLGLAWGLRGAILRLGGVVAQAAHASGALPAIVASWRKAGGAGVFVTPSESTAVFTHPDATPDEIGETLERARAWTQHELLRVIAVGGDADSPGEMPTEVDTFDPDEGGGA